MGRETDAWHMTPAMLLALPVEHDFFWTTCFVFVLAAVVPCATTVISTVVGLLTITLCTVASRTWNVAEIVAASWYTVAVCNTPTTDAAGNARVATPTETLPKPASETEYLPPLIPLPTV